MCGINGLTGKNQEAIERMNDCLKHRGPDFAGIYLDDEVSLGHALLSIRAETSSSRQPYTQPNSPWILLFNGQLYNTTTITKDLAGHVTNAELDTALLFDLITKYGWNFIDHIHGMYGIALYNKNEKIIRLYRDPTGQKNVYYHSRNDHFCFSSEIKAILPNLKSPKQNAEAIQVSATIGYLPGNLTVIDEIYKLLPSQVLTYDLTAKKLTTDFFNSQAPNYFPDDFSEAMQLLISEHLQSKQAVSINLSGGLDSSLLLYEMTKLNYPARSYSSFFEIENGTTAQEKKYNTDALLAARLAKDLGVEHTQINITPENYLANLKTAYATIEEPNYNISTPTYFEMAKQEGVHGAGNRVIFSGDGGDEVFGGYPHYFEAQKIASKIKKFGPTVYNLLKRLRDGTKVNWNNPAEIWYHIKKLDAYLTAPADKKLITDYINQNSSYFTKMYSQKNDPAYNLMLIDRIIWMASENFIRSDKLYMKESMEMRCPLAYHPFRLYVDQKIKTADYINESSNKIFLRHHYQNKLPDYIVNRPDKTGWRAPVSVWYNKEFKDKFLEIVGNRNDDIINWSEVRQIIKDSQNWPGKEIHYYLSLAAILDSFNIN